MPNENQTPKLELKNIKTFRGGEGYGLNADLVVNGKKICFVRDAGNGGCFDFDIYGKTDKDIKGNRAVLSMVTAYAESLPKRPFGGGIAGEFQPDLDTLIDDLFAEKENAKADKKLTKKMETHIILGVPNANSYRSVKLNLPLSQYPLNALQNFVNQLKPRMNRGEVFLNTNFPEGINSNR